MASGVLIYASLITASNNAAKEGGVSAQTVGMKVVRTKR